MSGILLKSIRLSAAVLLATHLSGCGLRLYSDVRDKQGIAAKDAWKVVDLASVITTEHANLNKLLDTELDTQDKLAASIRNHEVKFLVNQSIKTGLVDRAMERLDKLAGSGGVSAVTASRTWVSDLDVKQNKFKTTEYEFKAKGLAMPACSDLANNKLPFKLQKWLDAHNNAAGGDIDGAITRLRTLCSENTTDAFEVAYAGFSDSSEIAAALKTYKDDLSRLNALKDEAKFQQDEYQTALEAYNEALNDSQSTPKDTTLKAKVKAAAGKLDTVVKTLTAAQNAFSTQFISQERLDSLDKFVDVITQSTTDGKIPSNANKATEAFILLPGLLDDAKKSLADAKKPLALPLIIRRDQEQLNLEAANREILLLEKRVQLSKQLVQALYAQAVQYWQALAVISPTSEQIDAQKNNKALASHDIRRLYDLNLLTALTTAKTSSDEKELLYSAAALYLDGVNRLDAKRYKLEYLHIATFHEVSLMYSEVNVKKWNALIGTTVDQVATSAASGIKTDSVTAIISTFGILWIGNGVNN